MSTEIEGKCGRPSSCASCGVAEGDAVKLKKCAACCLVQYCSVDCKREHWPTHKRACKQRVAELHDEVLFRQPESSHFGDCPICYLPLSIDTAKSSLTMCCSKMICVGCCYANQKREREQNLALKCPFCRQPDPKSETEQDKWQKDRAEMNDPVAMQQMGVRFFFDGDLQSAIENYSKAAGLGDATAHYGLGRLHEDGHGVEKDESKAVHHYEQAAIRGHPASRFRLGATEWKNGRYERAVKHWIIAAKLGHDKTLECLKESYKLGFLSKDDFATALRGHQAAVDATKSSQREAAEAIKNKLI